MSTIKRQQQDRQNHYEKIKHLGEGQFANVYKARNIETGIAVAIKKIKLGSRYEARDGVNRTALREIKLLQEIKHKNIISLIDVLGHRNSIQLVFDYMDTDLENLIKDQAVILMLSHIKNILLQILLGLEYLHLHFILHREFFGTHKNRLISVTSLLQIDILADFGLARFFGSPNRCYTHQVVTRWYRAPELLYGARSYGTGIDIWAIGCIIAELLLRKPIFPGDTDLDQLIKIYKVLGTPSEKDWPGMTKLPDYIPIKNCGPGYPLDSIFTAATPDLIELISRCLSFQAQSRWTATKALQSLYFRSEPFQCSDSELPVIGKQRKRRMFNDDQEPAASRRKLEF